MNQTAAIIEDDEDLSFIFAEALHAAGFDTTIVRDGKAAMNYLESAAPEVIVLDLHLPFVAGTDILEYVRGDERLKQKRVIITTADARLAEVAGEKADFTLIKPISFSMLRDLTSRLK